MSEGQQGLWTLDGLFLLPYARLKYYKKLYSRLLKRYVILMFPVPQWISLMSSVRF